MLAMQCKVEWCPSSFLSKVTERSLLMPETFFGRSGRRRYRILFSFKGAATHQLAEVQGASRYNGLRDVEVLGRQCCANDEQVVPRSFHGRFASLVSKSEAKHLARSNAGLCAFSARDLAMAAWLLE